jgi:hypothetical protein
MGGGEVSKQLRDGITRTWDSGRYGLLFSDSAIWADSDLR